MTIDTLRAEPVLITDRVATAWANAHSVTRRALVAACVSSVAAAIVVPAPFAVRGAVALSGMLLVVAALVDLHESKLPNRLLAVALAAIATGSIATLDLVVIARTLAGCVIGGGLLLVVHLTRGVGMGDVKMAAVVGAGVGAVSLLATPVAIAVAAFCAATYGVLAHRRRLVLGPSLWLGWVLALALASSGWFA